MSDVETIGTPVLRLAPEGDAVTRRSPAGGLPQGRVRVLMAADLVAVTLALFGTYLLAEAIGPPAVIAPNWALVALAVAIPVGWLGVFAVYRLYEGETR